MFDHPDDRENHSKDLCLVLVLQRNVVGLETCDDFITWTVTALVHRLMTLFIFTRGIIHFSTQFFCGFLSVCNDSLRMEHDSSGDRESV